MNFIIAGFHLVVVYDDGTQPGDINIAILVPPTNAPAPPLINDATNRIYRGIDPDRSPASSGPPAARSRGTPRSAGAARPCRGRPLSQPRDVPRNLRSVAALQRWNGRVRQGGSVRVRQIESSDVSKRSFTDRVRGTLSFFWPTHRLSLCARPSDQRVIGPCDLRESAPAPTAKEPGCKSKFVERRAHATSCTGFCDRHARPVTWSCSPATGPPTFTERPTSALR